ncbi:sarcosine oxidase subunit gamma [Aestuariivirga litoralis]|uniref:sarcosine oxidase subunit gamma n=1 Tax=Aestuariivirga litoralis TaxID=2650924 RepID=UPI0018C798A0|nr:sarcosine oxidase subunit gamma family protein [Aestuariivirga litoralis]
MPDHRSLELRSLARQGRFGASIGEAGVSLELLHPVSLVQVLVRKGGAKVVETGLARFKTARVMQAGPGQYYVQAEGKAESALSAELKKILGTSASIVDQSHGRVVIRISGTKARVMLAKGMPLDLHPDVFAVGQSAQTQMAHVGIHVTRTAKDEFEISVFRGFSESLWEWLCTASAEFGYLVR